MKSLKKNKNILFILLASSFTIIYYWFLFAQTQYPPGKDGFWFIIQVRELIEKNKLHSYESTLLYPILKYIFYITHNYILSYKILIISLIIFTSYSMLFIFIQIYSFFQKEQDKINDFFSYPQILIWIFFIVFLISPTNRILSIQYPKQSLALIFFFFAFGFFLKFLKLSNRRSFKQEELNKNILQKRKIQIKNYFSKKNVIPLSYLFFSFLLLLLAIVNHRFIAGFFLIIIGIIIFYKFFSNKSRRKYFIIVSSLFILIISIVLFSFPSTLSFSDFTRITNAFTKKIYFIPDTLLSNYPFSILFVFETLLIFITILLFIIIRYFWTKNQNSVLIERNRLLRNIILLLFIPAILFNIPLFNFFDLQIRFALPSFLFLLIVLFFQMQSEEKIIHTIYYYKNKIIPMILFLFFVETVCLTKAYNTNIYEYNYKKYEKIIQKSQSFLKNKKYELLVMHKGLATFYDYTIHSALALPWRPEKRFNRKQVYRFVANISSNEILNSIDLDKTKIKEVIYIINSHYLIIREDIWDLFLNSLKNNFDEELEKRVFSFKNPHMIRPKYLHKNHK